MFDLLKGHFDLEQLKIKHIKEQNSLPYQAFFTVRFLERKSLLFVVNVEKIPVLDKNKTYIIRFDYQHVLRFLDIISQKDLPNISKITNKFFQELLSDFCKSDFIDELKEENQDKKRLYGKLPTLFSQTLIENRNYILMDDPSLSYSSPTPTPTSAPHSYHPSSFQPSFLSKKEASSFNLDLQAHRWTPADVYVLQDQAKLRQLRQELNSSLLKQLADFSSAGKLVDYFNNFPKFKIKLTEQEKSVISQEGNVLAIGRSGTGKTTCAVLRIFAIELLFRIRLKLSKGRLGGGLRDTRFGAEDLEENIGIHCVFVTASPVLTTEVERFYKRLKGNLRKKEGRREERGGGKKEEGGGKEKEEGGKEEGEKKREEGERKREEGEGVKKEEEGGREEEIIEQGDLTQEEKTVLVEEMGEEEEEKQEGVKGKRNEGKKEEGEEDGRKEEEEMIEMQKRMQKYTSLNQLTEENFPAFLTIKSLILMIDGCLTKPFFARNKEGQIIGGDSAAYWHNETHGVMMIERLHKEDGEEEERFEYNDEEELEMEYQRLMYLMDKKEQ